MKPLFPALAFLAAFLTFHPSLLAGLLAQDLFEYPAGTQLLEFAGDSDQPKSFDTLNRGIGWKGPWAQFFGQRQNDARIALEARVLDAFPMGITPKGGTAVLVYRAGLRRELARPIGGKGTTYVSFAMQFASGTTGDDTPVGVGFQLLSGGLNGKPVLSLWRRSNDPWGIDDKGDTKINNTGWSEDAQPHFYVLKIVDDGREATVSASRFGKDDLLTEEPTKWQVEGVKVPSFRFDAVMFKGNKTGYDESSARLWVDELSIGTDFNSTGANKANGAKRIAIVEARRAAEAKAKAEAKVRMAAAWKDVTTGGIAFPEDAGVSNVMEFGATGDGQTDDTVAMQAALDAVPAWGRIVYLPNGTYLISDTLKWPNGGNGKEWKDTILQGQSRDGVIIKLADKTPGFDNAAAPKAMVWTGPAPAQRFRNSVRDLTLDAGGNAGAVGLQFNCSNQGTVQDVLIRDGAKTANGKSGLIGLDMAFTGEIGPCLIRRVRVEGFGVGIKCGSPVNSMTLDHIELEGQKQAGLLNEGQVVSIRDIKSTNRVSAIVNAGAEGLITVIDSDFSGGDRMTPAILNKGVMFARGVKTQGYGRAITNDIDQARNVEELSVDEWVSQAGLTLDDKPAKSLRLPIEDAPTVAWGSRGDWVNPVTLGAIPNDFKDDTDAIQKALDSGKYTVYLPNGLYHITRPLKVPASVQRIIGCEAHLEIMGGMNGQDVDVFNIGEGVTPTAPLVIERLQGLPWEGKPFYWFGHHSKRTLILRNINMFCGNTYRNTVEGGKVFIEDVSTQTPGAGFWSFKNQQVWARQLNVEHQGLRIRNTGGTLWILGLKTERGGTLIETLGGGRTELLGGMAYALDLPKDKAMFVVKDSTFSATLRETVFDWGKPFTQIVEASQNGQTKTLKRGDAPQQLGGTLLSLFSTGAK